MVTWPSGLRRWFKAPVFQEAWVRIPPLPIRLNNNHCKICITSIYAKLSDATRTPKLDGMASSRTQSENHTRRPTGHPSNYLFSCTFKARRNWTGRRTHAYPPNGWNQTGVEHRLWKGSSRFEMRTSRSAVECSTTELRPLYCVRKG